MPERTWIAEILTSQDTSVTFFRRRLYPRNPLTSFVTIPSAGRTEASLIALGQKL